MCASFCFFKKLSIEPTAGRTDVHSEGKESEEVGVGAMLCFIFEFDKCNFRGFKTT